MNNNTIQSEQKKPVPFPVAAIFMLIFSALLIIYEAIDYSVWSNSETFLIRSLIFLSPAILASVFMLRRNRSALPEIFVAVFGTIWSLTFFSFLTVFLSVRYLYSDLFTIIVYIIVFSSFQLMILYALIPTFSPGCGFRKSWFVPGILMSVAVTFSYISYFDRSLFYYYDDYYYSSSVRNIYGFFDVFLPVLLVVISFFFPKWFAHTFSEKRNKKTEAQPEQQYYPPQAQYGQQQYYQQPQYGQQYYPQQGQFSQQYYQPQAPQYGQQFYTEPTVYVGNTQTAQTEQPAAHENGTDATDSTEI